MIVTYFSAPEEERPNTIGYALSKRAYPLETKAPERLGELLKRLDKR